MRRLSYIALTACASFWTSGCGSSPSSPATAAWTLPGGGFVSPGTDAGAGGDVGMAQDATAGQDGASEGLDATGDGGVGDGDGVGVGVGVGDGDGVGDGSVPTPDAGASGSDVALSPLDGDLDGWSPLDGDCDDQDAAVHPLHLEVCDGKDNNCDGKADDVDDDGDGFAACPGAGADCDDNDAKVFPGAPVDCTSGNDGNCDGKPDNANTGDGDGDGVDACNDCNDLDPKIFPGAAKDCTDGKDHDCNGVVDSLEDADKDGHAGCVDCDDGDATIYPLAPEVCNGKDDDCTGVIDDLDMDGDGWSQCNGVDCDDTDLSVNPSAGRNCKNGKDNDCNGVIDDQEDGDGDGFVGCKDCDDSNGSKNPNAIEVPADLIDNNCDGVTDEPPTDCDVAPMSDSQPADYARALDLCVPAGSTTIASNAFPVLADGSARAIKTAYGPQNKPLNGQHLVVLSTGRAAAVGQPGYVAPQSGTSFSNTAAYPKVSCSKSGGVNDYTEWKLVLKVPGNVNGFSFQFNFMSAEYPEWVNTQFDDKFLAVLESKKFNGNVSFDEKGNCVSINNAFFTVCKGCKNGDQGLQGTGYEGGIGGGTGWLTTTSPVEPGETITLRFIVFDEGDHILDSVVLLDNFRWEVLSSGQKTPSTVRPGG